MRAASRSDFPGIIGGGDAGAFGGSGGGVSGGDAGVFAQETVTSKITARIRTPRKTNLFTLSIYLTHCVPLVWQGRGNYLGREALPLFGSLFLGWRGYLLRDKPQMPRGRRVGIDMINFPILSSPFFYLPLNFGGLFSKKALIPFVLSAVVWSRK